MQSLYAPPQLTIFLIYLFPVLFCLLSAEVYTPFWSEVRNNDGLLGRIKHVYSSPLLPSSFLQVYTCMCIYPDCDKMKLVQCGILTSMSTRSCSTATIAVSHGISVCRRGATCYYARAQPGQDKRLSVGLQHFLPHFV